MNSILDSAPYNFSASMVGAAYLSPCLGALLGAVWAGLVGDKAALYLAHRNGGTREPEQRLWVLSVPGLVGAMGFVLWGVGAAHVVHYMGLIIGVGMVECAVVAGGSLSRMMSIVSKRLQV